MLRYPFLLLALAFALSAGTASAQKANRAAAHALGLAGPVTAEQGAAIAAHHTGAAEGDARLVEQETEQGVVLLEYLVVKADGPVEVEVRQSDGAVLEVEPADGEAEVDADGEAEDDDGPEDDDAEEDDRAVDDE
jgi:hypothetical protein